LIKLWRRHKKNPIVDFLVTVATAIVIAYIVQLWVVKPYRIPSESMEPTLHIGDRVITARFLYHLESPHRGDIIVFHPNGHGSDAFASSDVASVNYVKRLIGLPREVVGAVRGRLYICGNDVRPTSGDDPAHTPGCRFLDEPYTHGKPTGSCGDSGGSFQVVLGSGQYFMMGDNRTNSLDSRCWGAIRRSQIIGRSFMTYWPPNRLSVY